MVHRLPRLAEVVGPKHTRCRDGGEDPPGIARIQHNRVQAHSTCTWLPRGPGAVTAQAREFLPGLTAVSRAAQGGVFDPSVDGGGIDQRAFEMPDAREFPGVWGAIIPLVRARDAVVYELVAHRLPGFAAVVRTLDELPKPAGRLRCIQSVWSDGRSFEVVDLPTRKV